MGAGCCTWGINESETHKNTLKWASGWAGQLARDLAAVIDVIRRVGDPSRTNYDHVTREELIVKLDALNLAIKGVSDLMRDRYWDNDPVKGDGNNVLCHLSKQFDNIHEQLEGHLPVPTTFSKFAWEFRDIEGFHDGTRTVAYIDGNSMYLRMNNGYPGQFFEYILSKIRSAGCPDFKDAKVSLVFADKECVERVYEEYYDVGTKVTIYQKLRDMMPDLRLYYWDMKLMSDKDYLAEKKAKDEKDMIYADANKSKSDAAECKHSLVFNCPPVDDPLRVARPIAVDGDK